ncbi:MAG: DUF1150 domain-containing protein [Paracoccaceae bacterium]|nr:DUF1150 domain-containing protein [Paracoccaceae bacterium]
MSEDRKTAPIVYVRQVNHDELPDELRGTHVRLYALHDADGNRLAMTQDRNVAFALAKRNDMTPVSAH